MLQHKERLKISYAFMHTKNSWRVISGFTTNQHNIQIHMCKHTFYKHEWMHTPVFSYTLLSSTFLGLTLMEERLSGFLSSFCMVSTISFSSTCLRSGASALTTAFISSCDTVSFLSFKHTITFPIVSWKEIKISDDFSRCDNKYEGEHHNTHIKQSNSCKNTNTYTKKDHILIQEIAIIRIFI